jgi:hypothetical protein
MFLIIRNTNGVTETLKCSSDHLDKTFTDFHAANRFVQQLNQKIIPSRLSLMNKANKIGWRDYDEKFIVRKGKDIKT